MHVVTSLRYRQRHRAYTAPETRTNNLPVDHTHLQSQGNADTGATKVRKRSFSAVLPRNIPDVALRQLLSISRHTALLPQTDGEQEKLPEPQATPYTKPHPTYVTAQAEFMKIEMKGLRKNSSKDSSKTSPRPGGHTHNRHLPQVGKLPSIPDPAVESEETGTRFTITVTKSKGGKPQTSEHSGPITTVQSTAHHSLNIGDATSPSISGGVASSSSGSSHLTIVSLGDSKRVPGQMATPRTKLHSSVKGRLSQGWSPPQPIQPLKGSPLHRRVGGASISEEGLKVKPGSPTPSMVIDINVNEFLTENNDDD